MYARAFVCVCVCVVALFFFHNLVYELPPASRRDCKVQKNCRVVRLQAPKEKLDLTDVFELCKAEQHLAETATSLDSGVSNLEGFTDSLLFGIDIWWSKPIPPAARLAGGLEVDNMFQLAREDFKLKVGDKVGIAIRLEEPSKT